MRRLPSIMASGAVVVVWLTAATALAQELRVQGGARIEDQMKAREWKAAHAQAPSLLGLSNQLRPFYRDELMHVRTVCGLSRETLQEIRPGADAAYEKAMAGLETAGLVTDPPGDDDPNYRETIRKAVHSAVEPHLSRAQWAALQADLSLRAASRKEAGAVMLVAELDRELLLTAKQREQIAARLLAHWDDRWCEAIEAAYALESQCPDGPKGLLSPYLSAVQKETWHRVPRQQRRLWGVSIAHGNDPAMERALGGDGRLPPFIRRNWVLFDRATAVQGVRVVAQPAPAVVELRPAMVVRAAPVLKLDSDVKDDPDEAQQRQQEQARVELYRRRLFEQVVFGGLTREDEFRREAETALARRVDRLARTCDLTETERRKLQAAGQGDIKRFLDSVADARRGLPDADNWRNRLQEFEKAARPLRAEALALLDVAGFIFRRTSERTLTAQRLAALEKDDRDRRVYRIRADVGWTAILIARNLGLRDDQRRRFESLLVERASPPDRFEMSDYVILMYEASTIPEHEIRPVFDDLQWRLMTQEFAVVRWWELHMQGGVLPVGDDRDEAAPPIRLLAPPGNRR